MTDVLNVILPSGTVGQLRIFEDARRAIDVAATADEVNRILALATGLAAAARKASDRDLEAEAEVLKMEAERKLGQLMNAQKETVGFNKGGGDQRSDHRVSEKPGDPPTLAEAGIGKNLAHRARKAGAMSDEEFEGAKEAKRKAVRVPVRKPRAKKSTNELSPQPPEPEPPAAVQEVEDAKEAKRKTRRTSAEVNAEKAEESASYVYGVIEAISQFLVGDDDEHTARVIELLQTKYNDRLVENLVELARHPKAGAIIAAVAAKLGEERLMTEREFEIKYNGAQSEIAELKERIAELEAARNGKAESPANKRSIRQVAHELYGMMQELEPLASSKSQKDHERVLHSVMRLAMMPESPAS